MLVLPPGAASLDEAHAAIELWEHYSGKTADSAQRLAVEVMMAQTAGGKWAAATTGREMPRQNGKGDEVEIVELWGLVQRGEAIMHTVHDAVLLASQAQQRMLAMLEHKDLRPRIKRRWMGTGQQMIETRNGGVIWYRTRTAGGGRGVDGIDRVVIDEAQHATEEHLAAVAPTLLANPDPQMNVMGTAGIAGRSDWWWSVRLRALGDDPGSFGWVGHTAETVEVIDGRVVQHPVDVEDRDLWAAANPALVAGRTTVAFLDEQYRRLGAEAFAREHLGVWDAAHGAVSAAKIDQRAWSSTTVSGRDVPAVSPGGITMCFAVSLDGDWSSIGIAHGTLDSAYVELVEHRRGTAWLPGRVIELIERWDPTAVGCNHAGSTAAQLPAVLDALRAAGMSADRVATINAAQWKDACGGFYAAINEGQLSHLAGQTALDEAVASAGERRLGDGFAWNARGTSTPLSALDAVTGARALLPVTRQSEPVEPGFIIA